MQILTKHDAFTAIFIDCGILGVTSCTTTNILVNKHMQNIDIQ